MQDFTDSDDVAGSESGEEAEDVTLVNSHNGLNEISRLTILWAVRHRWLAGARFLIY